ncbi:MAG: ABC transporter substrate-binding protein, partial [Propionibacteriaceae bacterium]|nr:ABC transporter substrate-binding protein [Propionibacteriaceae bacterium]
MSSSLSPASSARPRRPLGRVLPLALAAAVALLTAACGASDPAGEPVSASADAADASSFSWAVENEPVSFNPFVNSQDAAGPLLRNLYDSYLFLDADGVYHPWLAESYEVSADGLQITLKLRPGVTFSDGEPLDADAAVLNLTKTQDPAIVESTSWATSVDKVEKLDDLTFRIDLKEPDVRVLARLATVSGSPLSPKDFDLGVDDLKFGIAVHGAGPYAVDSYEKGQQIVLKARSDYNWAPEELTGRNGPAYTSTVVYRFLAEASTRSGALQAGQVDAIDSVPPQDVSLFKDNADYQYGATQNAGTPYTLYFNVSRPPFDDVRVRQAIQHGVDLDKVVAAVYNGSTQAAHGVFSPVVPFYDKDLDGYLTLDLDLANRLLDEAGYSGRDADGYRVDANGERLSIPIQSNATFVRDLRDILNQAIAAEIKANLSIDYTFKVLDSGSWSEVRQANEYVAWDNSLNSNDIAAALAPQYHSNPAIGFINLGQIHDPAVDQLIDAGQRSYDAAERTAIYKEFQSYVLTEQSYVLPLYVLRHSWAAPAAVSGFLSDPATGQNWN